MSLKTKGLLIGVSTVYLIFIPYLNKIDLTRSISDFAAASVTAARYFIIIFEASVLPEPDSPVIITHVFRRWRLIVRYTFIQSWKGQKLDWIWMENKDKSCRGDYSEQLLLI